VEAQPVRWGDGHEPRRAAGRRSLSGGLRPVLRGRRARGVRPGEPAGDGSGADGGRGGVRGGAAEPARPQLHRRPLQRQARERPVPLPPRSGPEGTIAPRVAATRSGARSLRGGCRGEKPPAPNRVAPTRGVWRSWVSDHAAKLRSGFLFGLVAYVWWGLVPLYFAALKHFDVPATEI